ncbi:hypothetical protein EV122DRAFT_286751 [Schizophyllum commune]
MRVVTVQRSNIALEWVSYTLHGSLIALHITLLIVYGLHLEKHIMIHLSDHWIGRTSTAMTVTATLFATVYATTLIWLTQRLTFRRLLSHVRSLTAIHDEYNSWIGLGSAFLTLWAQRTNHGALRWVVYTTIYLGAIETLHVTIPAMFTLQVGTIHRSSTISSELAYTDNILGDASSLLPYLALLSSELSVGLDTATIYDRLPVNIGDFNTTVNATTFNVECGLLYSLKVSGNHSDPESDEVAYYDVSHAQPNSVEKGYVKLLYLSHNNTAVLTQQDASSGIHSVGNRSFYLYGTYDIEDSVGNTVPTLELAQTGGLASNISMIGCDLYAQNHTIKVNTTSRLPLPGEVPGLRDSATWSMWEPQELLDSFGPNMMDLWTMAFKMQYTTSLSLEGTAGSSPTKDIYLGFMESFVISALGLDISESEGKPVRHPRPRGRVQLYDVENALSRLAAAFYWSLSRIESNNRYGTKNLNSVPIWIPVPVRQVQLNVYPIALGLAASVVLLTMSHLLVRPRSTVESRPDIPKTLGLLQFLWFVLHVLPGEIEVFKRATSTEEDLRRQGCSDGWISEDGINGFGGLTAVRAFKGTIVLELGLVYHWTRWR